MLTTTASCVCHMQHGTEVSAIAKLAKDTSMAGMRPINIPCMHKHGGRDFMTGACTFQSLLMRREDIWEKLVDDACLQNCCAGCNFTLHFCLSPSCEALKAAGLLEHFEASQVCCHHAGLNMRYHKHRGILRVQDSVISSKLNEPNAKKDII